jgi:hypothetical protein
MMETEPIMKPTMTFMMIKKLFDMIDNLATRIFSFAVSIRPSGKRYN